MQRTQTRGERLVSCVDFTYIQELNLDCKNVIILSEDKNLDFKSIKNMQFSEKVHSLDPVIITITHKTGEITCCGLNHGNFRVGNKNFYTNFLEIPYRTPDIFQ